LATVVVYTGRAKDLITSWINGGSVTVPKAVGWGNSAAAPTAATTDVAPFGEAAEARVTGTSSVVTTTTTNDTYQVVGTITSASGQTINESILALSTTKPFSTTVAGGTVVGSNSGTTLTTAASYTPANGTYIQVRGEVMLVTAGTGTTSLTVTRGQNGSTASSAIATSDPVTLGNPPGSSVANADLFIHASYPGLALNALDALQATFKLQFT
jgi:hypothetical protein